jgi:hypothetical protein
MDKSRFDQAISLLDQATMRVADFANPAIRVVRRDEAEAILREALVASETEDRQAAIHANDCPQFRAFYMKYAIGSKLCPSCLLCGHQVFDRSEWGITHAELPDIYICKVCVRGRGDHDRIAR